MGLNFTIDMTWGRLILLSLSKNRPKNHSPDTRGAGKWWLSQCTVAPAAFWKCVFFGTPCIGNQGLHWGNFCICSNEEVIGKCRCNFQLFRAPPKLFVCTVLLKQDRCTLHSSFKSGRIRIALPGNQQTKNTHCSWSDQDELSSRKKTQCAHNQMSYTIHSGGISNEL